MIKNGGLNILHIKMTSSILKWRYFKLIDFLASCHLFTYYCLSFSDVLHVFTGLCTGQISGADLKYTKKDFHNLMVNDAVLEYINNKRNRN